MCALNAGIAAAIEPDVLFRIANRVAIITLNRPAALNALSHTMVLELTRLIERCRTDDEIVAVVLKGAGEKSFCAGGDVREVHRSASNGDGRWKAFFIDEYRLDYALHTFPKPVVALMDGISMGGGMGLAQGARLRIVTERTKIAMPETRIGFIPDVGATFFLKAMPVEIALYVALTGATLSGADALRLQLADLCVPSEWLATAEERLQKMPVDGDVLAALRTVFEPPCNIVPHSALSPFTPLIVRHFDARSRVDRMVASLHQNIDRGPSREVRQWLQSAWDALTTCSPTLLHVTREALLRGRHMMLAEAFRMELGIGRRVIEEGDFLEGVRAHLIDKDRQPRWAPRTLAEVRPERVLHFLSSPWRSDGHPLADLGQQRVVV